MNDERLMILEAVWNSLAQKHPGKSFTILRLMHPDPHSDFIIIPSSTQYAVSPHSLEHQLCQMTVNKNGSGKIKWLLSGSIFRPCNRGK